jgi:hypothetical protein
MNPYEVLRVASSATDAEIKKAYRELVKRYHPDKTGGASDDAISEINAAYEILSDPRRRHAYDNRFSYLFVDAIVEEDPREVYRREFIRKKQEEAAARRARQEPIFRRMFRINLVLTILTSLVVIDPFLPSLHHDDTIRNQSLVAWSSGRGNFRTHYLYTDKYELLVPEGLFLEVEDGTPVLIKSTPVFRVPTYVEVETAEEVVSFEPSGTVYSFPVPAHYIMLIACLSVIFDRRYNEAAFHASFIPSGVGLIILIYLLV